MRSVCQKLPVLTLYSLRFVAMKMISRVALLVFDASLFHVFFTSRAEDVFRGDQPLQNIVQSVIVVFKDVRKLILSHYCSTGLLSFSFGAVHIVSAWLQSTYDHPPFTCPPSSSIVIKKIEIIQSSQNELTQIFVP